IAACTRCPLHCNATQAVPGEGPMDADLMIVGEQPGDQEDLSGRPFVGPAGQLFDQIAGQAGLERGKAFLTNAVKHFKFTPRGKRRLHQRPNASEIRHCRWWLDAEIAQVRPKLVLAMGATAAEGLTGRRGAILSRRGKIEETPSGTPALLTLHPSYLLRLTDPHAKADATAQFRDDLSAAVRLLA
ncbi:MAG: UdgX family uracil-DNA binding protein, partial [Sulfitobacter sp.]